MYDYKIHSFEKKLIISEKYQKLHWERINLMQSNTFQYEAFSVMKLNTN